MIDLDESYKVMSKLLLEDYSEHFLYQDLYNSQPIWNNLPQEVRDSIYLDLINKYHDRHYDSLEEFDKWQTDMSGLNNVNSCLLVLQGYGKNRIWMNDFSRDDLSQYNNLNDYALKDHKFQEEARAKDFKDYVEKPYTGHLYGQWTRMFISSKFHYVNLWNLGSYIHTEVDNVLTDMLRELIPYEYVDGPEHGKKTECGNTRWNLVVDANGLEEQHEKLQKAMWEYNQEVYDELSMEFLDYTPSTYIIDTSEADEERKDFIYTNPKTLQNITFENIHQDTLDNHGNIILLNEIVEEFKQKAEDFMIAKHEEVMNGISS